MNHPSLKILTVQALHIKIPHHLINHHFLMPPVDHNSPEKFNNQSTDIPTTSQPTPVINIRRFQRHSRPPKYTRDFHCNLLSQQANPTNYHPLHIGHSISYNRLSQAYRQFLLNVSSQLEPRFFYQVAKYPQW